jgi:hypothetical protein
MTCLKGNVKFFIMDKLSNGENHREMLKNMMEFMFPLERNDINDQMDIFDDRIQTKFCDAYTNGKRDKRNMECLHVEEYVEWLYNNVIGTT